MVFDLLSNFDFDVNKPSTRSQTTALHIAVKGKYIDIVEYLVDEKGADPKIPNKNYDDSLHIAIGSGASEIA